MHSGRSPGIRLQISSQAGHPILCFKDLKPRVMLWPEQALRQSDQEETEPVHKQFFHR